MSVTNQNPALALFEGIDQAVNLGLGISNYHHKSACLELGNRVSQEGIDSTFLPSLFELLAENWHRAVGGAGYKPSEKNWRWFEPVTDIAPHNTSPEVTLERALVKAAVGCHREDWSNQIPIMSGLVDSTSFRRRAIDLVHQRNPGAFDFVELKIASDTPLFAAIEIIIYGFIWVLSSQHQTKLGYENKSLLLSRDARFCVLAPTNYFEGYDLADLEKGFRTGLENLGRGLGYKLDFIFQSFPQDFEWPHSYTSDEMCSLFDRREKAYADEV